MQVTTLASIIARNTKMDLVVLRLDVRQSIGFHGRSVNFPTERG